MGQNLLHKFKVSYGSLRFTQFILYTLFPAFSRKKKRKMKKFHSVAEISLKKQISHIKNDNL